MQKKRSVSRKSEINLTYLQVVHPPLVVLTSQHFYDTLTKKKMDEEVKE